MITGSVTKYKIPRSERKKHHQSWHLNSDGQSGEIVPYHLREEALKADIEIGRQRGLILGAKVKRHYNATQAGTIIAVSHNHVTCYNFRLNNFEPYKVKWDGITSQFDADYSIEELELFEEATNEGHSNILQSC